MDKIIEVLKERIQECKQRGSVFCMPEVDGCSIEKRSGATSGSILSHSIFVLTFPDGRTVTVDYTSRDKSRPFSMVPDRSSIRITCSDHRDDFSDSWDES